LFLGFVNDPVLVQVQLCKSFIDLLFNLRVSNSREVGSSWFDASWNILGLLLLSDVSRPGTDTRRGNSSGFDMRRGSRVSATTAEELSLAEACSGSTADIVVG